MAAGATEAGSMRVTEPSAASDTTEDTGGRIFGEVGAIRGEIGSAAAALDAALAAADGREFSSSSDAGRSSSSGSGPPDPDALTARIISTSNQLEDEPWLPVRNIVTMYRIACTAGAEKQWEVLRRYSDFAELHLRLGKALDPAALPPLPPKLVKNDVEDIAERYLELDAYLRKLLATPATAKHGRLLDFLGAEKHGVRYGVRRYEYDSAQSEGNKYIRDDQL